MIIFAELTLINNENPKKSNADVYYYTITEMCNNINQYFEYIELPNRINIDTTVGNLKQHRESFEYQCKAISLPDKEFPGDSYRSDIYAMLQKYIANASIYAKYLDNGIEPFTFRDIDKGIEEDAAVLSELRKRIAFFDINNNPSFDVLAVKKVEIYKHFTIDGKEVGKLKFTDTCGIGERRLGIDDELKRVILRDADIAVAVAKIPDDDTTLTALSGFHNLISSVLKGEDVSMWFYYLINQKDTISNDRAKDFRLKVADAVSGLGLRIPSQNIQITKPNNPTNVNNFILKSILEPITASEESIKAIDNVLFEKTRDEIVSIDELYDSFIDVAKRIVVPIVNIDDKKEKEIVNCIFPELRKGVDNLTSEIYGEYEDSALKNLEEEFESIICSPAGYDLTALFFSEIREIGEVNAVKDFINEKKDDIIMRLRIRLTGETSSLEGNELSAFVGKRQDMIMSYKNRFNSISHDYLVDSINQIKDKIGELFISEDKGRLSFAIIDDHKDENSRDILYAIANFANKSGLFCVADFFRSIREFQIQYIDTVINDIERILNRSRLQVSIHYKEDPQGMATNFYDALFKIDSLTKENLRNYLKDSKMRDIILIQYAKHIESIKHNLLSPYMQEDQYNQLYREWIMLYKKLYHRIFDEQDLVRLEKGYKQWEKVEQSLMLYPK